MTNSVNLLSSKTILIVDDTPNNLKLLFEYLSNAGYKILVAQSGKKAIKTALAVYPDLILLDVMMSGLNGFDICRHLKANASTKDIPIIFMTALAETENKVQGFKLGAVDYITKPIDREELLARINTHLSLQSLHQRLARDAAQQKLFSQRCCPTKITMGNQRSHSSIFRLKIDPANRNQRNEVVLEL